MKKFEKSVKNLQKNLKKNKVFSFTWKNGFEKYKRLLV